MDGRLGSAPAQAPATFTPVTGSGVPFAVKVNACSNEGNTGTSFSASNLARISALAFALPSVPDARPWNSSEASVRTVAISASAETAAGASVAGVWASIGVPLSASTQAQATHRTRQARPRRVMSSNLHHARFLI